MNSLFVCITTLTESCKDAILLAVTDCGKPFGPALEDGEWTCTHPNHHGVVTSVRVRVDSSDVQEYLGQLTHSMKERGVIFLSVVSFELTPEGLKWWLSGGILPVVQSLGPYRSPPEAP